MISFVSLVLVVAVWFYLFMYLFIYTWLCDEGRHIRYPFRLFGGTKRAEVYRVIYSMPLRFVCFLLISG